MKLDIFAPHPSTSQKRPLEMSVSGDTVQQNAVCFLVIGFKGQRNKRKESQPIPIPLESEHAIMGDNGMVAIVNRIE